MMFWQIYFWILTSAFLLTYIVNHACLKFLPYQVDLCVSIPGLIGLFAFAYQKNFLSKQFWQKYVPLYFLWDIYFNLKLLPAIEVRSVGVLDFLAFAVIFPMWLALYRYAFVAPVQEGQRRD